MLDSKAAVAAIGSLKKLPAFSDIEIGLLDKDVRQTFIFFLFSNHFNFRGLCLARRNFRYSDETEPRFSQPYLFSSLNF